MEFSIYMYIVISISTSYISEYYNVRTRMYNCFSVDIKYEKVAPLREKLVKEFNEQQSLRTCII